MAGSAVDISNSLYAHAYAQITVGTSSATLAALLQAAGAPPIPSWALMAYLTPETAAIRYRCDGTAPTAAIGQPVQELQSMPVQGSGSLANLQMIAQGASGVTVSIEFRG